MAEADVKITVDVETAKAMQAWAQLSAGPSKLTQNLQQIGKQGKRTGESLKASIQGALLSYDIFSKIIGEIRTQMTEQLKVVKELRREYGNIGISQSQAIQNFFAQAQITDPRVQQQFRQRLAASSVRTRYTPGQLAQISFELFSAGVGVEDITKAGGMAERIAKLHVVGAQRGMGGVGVKQFTDMITGAIAAQNMPVNAQTLGQMLPILNTMIAGSKFQMPMLQQFTQRAGAIQGFTGAGFQQNLAFFSSLVSAGRTAPQAGTALERITQFLAAPKQEQKKGMEMLGLAPEQIDLRGESLLEVLDLFAKIREADPRKYIEGATQLFGEHVGAFGLLIDRRQQAATLGRARGGEAAIVADQIFKQWAKSPAGFEAARRAEKERFALTQPEQARELQRAQLFEERMDRLKLGKGLLDRINIALAEQGADFLQGLGLDRQMAQDIATNVIARRQTRGTDVTETPGETAIRELNVPEVVVRNEADAVQVQVEAGQPGDE